MNGRADERAVSVQVGAVLLLAILVSALGLYQLNVVPDQNYVVEADHNERVQGELQDVRNAIVNTAGDRADRSASVRLGTQYDARAVAINPPNPTGTIRTVEPATPITVENAEIDDDRIADLLDDDVETRFIEYRPRYNEYRNAPRTQFEHTLLYNEFGEGNVTIADQRLLREGTLDLVVVDGDLSRTGGGTVSVDVRTLGGPGETTIRPDGGTPELTIPTDAPARWEAAIGTEFDEGESDARVASVDDGSVTIELDEAFDLRVAKVEVGSGGESDDRYDGEPTSEIRDGVDRRFDARWLRDSVEIAENSDYEDVDVEVIDNRTGETIEDTGVDFSTGDGSVVGVDQTESDDRTDSDGQATARLEPVETGDTTVYAVAGDDVDRLPVTVVPAADPLEFAGNANTDGDDIEFDVLNDGDAVVTVTGVAVDTDLASSYDRGNGADNREVMIGDADGELGWRATNDDVSADGTVLELDGQPSGQEAQLDPGAAPTVDIGDFENGDPVFDDLEHTTDSSEADVTVTLVTTTGDVEFHFVAE